VATSLHVIVCFLNKIKATYNSIVIENSGSTASRNPVYYFA